MRKTKFSHDRQDLMRSARESLKCARYWRSRGEHSDAAFWLSWAARYRREVLALNGKVA